MKSSLCTLIASFSLLSSCAQPVERGLPTQTLTYRLGNETVTVTHAGAPVEDYILVRLHDNESTAAKSADGVVRRLGGSIVSINNDGERIMGFDAGDEQYRFDPNRIFTPRGREETLKVFGNYGDSAAAQLQGFAAFLLRPMLQSRLVIAVHNNSNGNYSILDYMGELAQDAVSVYINEAMDADDFVLTTDTSLFAHLRSRKINAVLQNNERVTDDGSLSVFYGRIGRRYANIEAEEGHDEEQVRMLEAVLDFGREGVKKPS